MKTLHVLYTGLWSDTLLTGGDQLFIDIAPRLPKEIKIILIIPAFAKKHWDHIDQSNIEYRLLPTNRFDLKGNPIAIFMSYVIRAWQVYRILNKERDQIQTLYSSSDIAYADIWPAYLITGKNSQIRWLSRVYHVILPPKDRQGNGLVNVVAFYLQRLSFWMMKRRSSTIFALNPKLRNELLDLGFPQRKLDVLGAGIDFKGIHAFKPSKKYPYDVAVLGRIAPVKGIFDTVKIWKQVHAAEPTLQLAWIGGGQESYQRQLREELAENSLDSTFHPLGFLDKDEAYSILKSSKIFLCPDHENGWGLAVCEAMASGLPVISYDLDIFGSVYQKGFRSVPLFDTESFAKAIIELHRDEKSRQKMAQEALAQASEFDHDRVVSKLEGYIYEDEDEVARQAWQVEIRL